MMRILAGLLGIAIGFIPLWFYLMVRLAFSPNGFWQEFILFGLGVYFLGFIQIILLGLLVWYLWALWVKRSWMGFWGI